VGAGTHPGAGIPAVLASGKIAANLIAGRRSGRRAATAPDDASMNAGVR
jgi:phytoene desaturase